MEGINFTISGVAILQLAGLALITTSPELQAVTTITQSFDDSGWTSTGGAVLAVTSVAPSTSGSSNPTTVKGVSALRDILAMKRAGPDGRQYRIIETPDGLVISSDTGVQGELTLSYEFSSAVDISSFIDGSNPAVEIDWESDIGGSYAWLTVTDTSGASATTSFSGGADLAGGFVQGTYVALLSELGGVDLTSAGSLEIVITNPQDLDGMLRDVRVSATIPEPSRAALILVALSATFLRRSR